MASISGQLEELYRAHSRKDVNSTLTGVLLSACAPAAAVPSRLVMEPVLVLSILHHTVGVEVGTLPGAVFRAGSGLFFVFPLQQGLVSDSLYAVLRAGLPLQCPCWMEVSVFVSEASSLGGRPRLKPARGTHDGGEAWSHQRPLWVDPDLPAPSCVKQACVGTRSSSAQGAPARCWVTAAAEGGLVPPRRVLCPRSPASGFTPGRPCGAHSGSDKKGLFCHCIW